MDPEAFAIIDGKLYLSWDSKAMEAFKANATGNIPKADLNWKKLTEKP